ncbi:rod-binding protein [Falsigemmobacter faecalis]|uniref:Flagellar protein FlgJ N-terminal domain-containing protein n=1 Tax=Falsigemmobacter faecalis TaxID=2488730 RepID=A0A3P3DQ04_9RHOB|nr:rod-binding protein [Falsigemmobacter faecalis]RRH75776.1 hypothetical protein EG244_07565 [Falsigemmobacter faecalis]
MRLSLPAATTPPDLTPATARRPETAAETARRFETAMLTPMVSEMLRTAGEEAMGGKAGGQWRSFFAAALAEEIAATGQTGIAQSVERAIAAYAK